MSFTLNKLTEGIRDRHVGQQNKRLVEKWSRTGLLRGMEEVNRENMATLLENQAAQALRENSTMGAGDVGGFTNIAFPIVRRVFGGLIANELVSIQPMSLPSGLLFYLDYTYGDAQGPYAAGDSIYGGPKGRKLQGGADAVGGQYDLVGSGYSKEYGTQALAASRIKQAGADGDLIGVPAAGVFGQAEANALDDKILATDADHLKLIQHDPQLLDKLALGQKYIFVGVDLSHNDFATADLEAVRSFSLTDLKLANNNQVSLALDDDMQGENSTSHNVRRLNQIGKFVSGKFVADATVDRSEAVLLTVVRIVANGLAANALAAAGADQIASSFVKADQLGMSTDQPFGEVSAKDGMPLEANTQIPEIDIKIESIPVTAQTRKLRAKWSPELAQDLNAYHSMDAEVELTQILSEQIALEIDREILSDLLNGAQGANFFWSRSPGKFVNKRTGAEIARASTVNPGPAFTGTVREWYETLTETVIDVANEIHRKTLRGSANFIVVSPDVATVLEASVLYRPSYSIDGDGQVGAPFTMGAEKMGTLSNRFTVYKDPYFPRNKILVGYKGGSYLETGFVYAPYVPLIVTPTIFQPEDFTPRKGVMTRYGKKMVRADFYGTVTCLDMNII